MKMFFKSFMTLSLLVMASAFTQAQSLAKVECTKVSAEGAKCKPASCDPALCDAMVAAGLCSEEEAALCKAKIGKTKVASVKLERAETEENKLSSIEFGEQANIQKKIACSKTCTKTNLEKSSKSMK